jgi:hypothetical protein
VEYFEILYCLPSAVPVSYSVHQLSFRIGVVPTPVIPQSLLSGPPALQRRGQVANVGPALGEKGVEDY